MAKFSFYRLLLILCFVLLQLFTPTPLHAFLTHDEAEYSKENFRKNNHPTRDNLSSEDSSSDLSSHQHQPAPPINIWSSPQVFLLHIFSYCDPGHLLLIRLASKNFRCVADEASRKHHDLRFRQISQLRYTLETAYAKMDSENSPKLSFYGDMLQAFRQKLLFSTHLTLEDKQRISHLLLKESQDQIELYNTTYNDTLNQSKVPSFLQKMKDVFFNPSPDETFLDLWPRLALCKAFEIVGGIDHASISIIEDFLLEHKNRLSSPFLLLFPTAQLSDKFVSLSALSIFNRIHNPADLKALAQELSERGVEGLRTLIQQAHDYIDEHNKQTIDPDRTLIYREWGLPDMKDAYDLAAFHFSLAFHISLVSQSPKYVFTPSTYFTAARAFFLNKQWDQAITYFSKIREKLKLNDKGILCFDSGYGERTINFTLKDFTSLGYACVKIGQWEQAKYWYEYAEDASKQAGYRELDTKHLFAFALTHLNLGEWEKAGTLYTQAISNVWSPKSKQCFYAGFAYSNLEQWEQAATYYLKGIRKASHPPIGVYIDTAWALFKLGKLNQAETYTNKARELLLSSPKDASLPKLFQKKLEEISESLKNK